MASLYPVVPRSPSSRIPSLRTSKHFRKNSSHLELLKANLQRQIFIERENKLCQRVYSAGDAEELSSINNKRNSLPPLRDVSSVGGIVQRRRKTIGDSSSTYRYGTGRTKLSPIKVPNKVPDLRNRDNRAQNRRYSREKRPSETKEPEIINAPKPPRQALAAQRRAEREEKHDVREAKRQEKETRRHADEKKQTSADEKKETSADEKKETSADEYTESSVSVSETTAKSSDFDINPAFAASHIIPSDSPERKEDKKWDVCTDIEPVRSPTPLNLPDEGDLNMFRRGSSPAVVPPIVAKVIQHAPTPTLEPEPEEKPITTRTGLIYKPPKAKKKTISSPPPYTLEEIPTHAKDVTSQPALHHSPVPKPKIRSPFPKKNENKQDDGPTPQERNKMQVLIKRKEAELMKRIADEERALREITEAENMGKNKKKKNENIEKTPITPVQKKHSLSRPGPTYAEFEAEEQEKKRKSYLDKYKQKLKEETLNNGFRQKIRAGDRDRAADALYLTAEDGSPNPVELVPCGMCGRKFTEDRLNKHTQICNKVSAKERKTFDSTKYRAEGTEFERYVKNGMHLKNTPKLKNKKNWKTQHEEFQSIVKSARTGEAAPPISNPDYVACPHCNRTFNEDVAERHIPLCKDRTTRPAPMKINKRM